MLTRLEVDGFKNLLGLTVDFGPYTCIVGPNAVGKSNIFDAIEFLSLLADHQFLEAAQKLRSVGSHGGDPRSLFWNLGVGESAAMKIAVEMIVPQNIEDDFGQSESPTTSFLRYEVELSYRPTENGRTSSGGISLVREELRHIKLGDAAQRLRWPHSKKNFRDRTVFGRRSGSAYISTEMVDGVGTVKVHADGGSRGQPRTSPVARAPRTIVSTTTTSDHPTILAARREMQQWRMLALEPSAMRSPDLLTDSSHILANGAHLASALNRLAAHNSDNVYASVASAAAALTDVRDVVVDFDPRRELLTLNAQLGSGPLLPARALSDGTLRFLALCIIAQDPSFSGLLCMEEPENGIHPGRVEAMVNLVRDLAVDPFFQPGDENPLRQVVVNTHSPFYVQYQNDDDIILAVPASLLRDKRPALTVRLVPLADSWRARSGIPSVGRGAIAEYLEPRPNGQLTLDLDRVG
ncbi:AAA family ATPase [Frankia sp. Ag45/Mut15]|uniref:AAA family ATPase n=1 Tax=Frankia umida TaxID=573489 RepID=A0ABT0JVR6_9ACTN|nr:ATP-binding protein [Frankia umida]MCK9875638.1 AAA family ATPase [Frankia umida]